MALSRSSLELSSKCILFQKSSVALFKGLIFIPLVLWDRNGNISLLLILRTLDLLFLALFRFVHTFLFKLFFFAKDYYAICSDPVSPPRAPLRSSIQNFLGIVFLNFSQYSVRQNEHTPARTIVDAMEVLL